MTIYLERITKILDKFKGSDRDEIIDFYVSLYRENLANITDINFNSLRFLKDVSSFNTPHTEELQKETIRHKVLQTRALILDLITSDYTKDSEVVEKPEKWVTSLVKDIQVTFDLEDDFYRNLFIVYNDELLEEFKTIFVSSIIKFGSAGNQLLVNLAFYERFVASVITVDMEALLGEIRSNFNPGCAMSKEEIEKLVKTYERVSQENK